jgi:hypothetical protein
MDTEAQPKDLRIRYDRSTSYELPIPMACWRDAVACSCTCCQAGLFAIFARDFSEWQRAVQRWVVWVTNVNSSWPEHHACARQCGKLSEWLRRQRTLSS